MKYIRFFQVTLISLLPFLLLGVTPPAIAGPEDYSFINSPFPDTKWMPELLENAKPIPEEELTLEGSNNPPALPPGNEEFLVITFDNVAAYVERMSDQGFVSKEELEKIRKVLGKRI